MSALGQKRTCAVPTPTSAKGQWRTRHSINGFAPSKNRITLLRASDADDAFVISRHDQHEAARRAGAARAHVSFVADDH